MDPINNTQATLPPPPTGLLHSILNPTPTALLIAILLAVTIPIFLHTVVFKSAGLTTLPSILLVGPSGSGKTALVTLVRSLLALRKTILITYTPQFERGTSADTRTSQSPLSVEVELPVGTKTGSDKYRSDHDPTSNTIKKFFLVDTPGHGKLRHHAIENVTNPQNLRGVIFLVDSATLSAGEDGLRQTADYLHDILLLLQKRKTVVKGSRQTGPISLLIAANKMDLFTALPAALVKNTLESEIAKVRVSRSKGLLDSGIGMGDADDDNDDWLGEMGSTDFKFAQLEEFDVNVEVMGGNVVGGDGPSVDKWWKWISQQL